MFSFLPVQLDHCEQSGWKRSILPLSITFGETFANSFHQELQGITKNDGISFIYAFSRLYTGNLGDKFWVVAQSCHSLLGTSRFAEAST